MAFVGSCQDMCPPKERLSRYGLYMSIFEKDENNQPDEFAMVKEYRRSGADQEEPSPADLRTLGALDLTMNYLASKIMDDPRSKQADLAIEWYDFLWDRLRAIRKDITQQNICDQRTAFLVERCARFHVHTCYALNRIKDFDVELNKRNLNDCLQMLRQMYSDIRTTSGAICQGEMEFQKYDILLHLNDDQLSSTLLMKTSDHRTSIDMKFIIKVFSAYTNNDCYKFFQLMEKADYMTSCILSLYANKVRIVGFKLITHACSSTRQATLYPAESIIHCLGFDGFDDLYLFTKLIGIDIQTKDGKQYLTLSRDLITSIRRAEEHLEPFKSYRLVESKMQAKSLGHLVFGGQIENNRQSITPVHQIAIDDSFQASPGLTESFWQHTSTPAPTPIPKGLPSASDSNSVDISTESTHSSLQSIECEIVSKIDKSLEPRAVFDYKETTSTIEQQIFDTPPIASEIIVDELKHLEQQVVALGEQTNEEEPDVLEENIEPGLEDLKLSFLARAIQKRSLISKDQLADMMPAGRFKSTPLASKRPTLKVPDAFEQQVVSTPKRRRVSLETKQTIDSFKTTIQDEERVNKIFQELTSMITQ